MLGRIHNRQDLHSPGSLPGKEFLQIWPGPLVMPSDCESKEAMI